MRCTTAGALQRRKKSNINDFAAKRPDLLANRFLPVLKSGPTKIPGRERMHNPLRIAGLCAATAWAVACALPATAQEVTGGATTTARPMTRIPNVSQAALNNAAKNKNN